MGYVNSFNQQVADEGRGNFSHKTKRAKLNPLTTQKIEFMLRDRPPAEASRYLAMAVLSSRLINASNEEAYLLA
jgi:hypothetical protein